MHDVSNWPKLSAAQADAVLTAPGAPFEVDDVSVRGRVTRVWKNALPTMAYAVDHMRQFVGLPYAVHGQERIDYAGFIGAVDTLGALLAAQGVGKGDRVALAMRNLPEWPVAFFAVTAIGAIVVPLNAWWTGAELSAALLDCGAVVLIADAERFDRLAAHSDALPMLRYRIVARGMRAGADALDTILGPATEWHRLPPATLPAVDLSPDDHATIFYTSGTTGSPKGALGSHRALLTAPLCQGYSYYRALVRAGEIVPAPTPKVLLCAIPFFHVSGCHGSMLAAILGGSKLVIVHRWDPGETLRLIEAERVTITGGVPTLAWQLLEHPDRTRYDLSSLETIGYGGAPAAPELVRRLATDLPGNASTGWGMTETSATVISHMREEYAGHPDSCGLPTPVSRLRIVDPATGSTLGIDAVGELQVSGPMVVEGYWNKPDETAAVFDNGWLRTGDLARIDAEGYCYIVGRAKDLVIRGGENIYPPEVEAALFEHPAVDDAAVIGIADHILGEVPVAVVHFAPGRTATQDTLRAWVAARLAAYKVPVRVVIVPDLLPRNANGKVLKADLSALFVQNRSGSRD